MNVDYDDLNAAALDLLKVVMEYAPERFSIEQKNKFQKKVLKKLLQYVHRDTLCPLPQSTEIFKQAFNHSEFVSLPKAVELDSVKNAAKQLRPKLDFTLYATVFGALDRSLLAPKEHLRQVEEEINRCHHAIQNNYTYQHRQLLNGKLSFEAQETNKTAFKRYYDELCRQHVLFTAKPSVLADRLDAVIAQAQELQDLFEIPTAEPIDGNMEAAIAKRRSRNVSDDLGELPYSVKGTI